MGLQRCIAVSSISPTRPRVNGKLPLFSTGEAMPSGKDYRYYRLDGVGHLEGAEWFEADGDDHAIAQVSMKHPHDKCEIWEGRRLVAGLAPKRLQA
jgi:hypothetical protein